MMLNQATVSLSRTLCELDWMIFVQYFKVAKKEAVEYSRVNKEELARETQQLYKLLQHAKTDRQEQDKILAELQASLDDAKKQKDQALKKFDMDRFASFDAKQLLIGTCDCCRDIYARMLKEDRDNFTSKIEKTEQVVLNFR
jgi:hypothetical protein